jgi:hypothetical protein
MTPGRGGANGDDQDSGDEAGRVEARFAIVVSVVLQGDSRWVGKNTGGQVEIQFVFGLIGGVFSRVPLENHRSRLVN